jgi:hypothetical protein
MDSLPNLSTVIHKETKQIREEAARKEENDTTVSYRERAPPKKAIRRPMLEQKSSSTPRIRVHLWTIVDDAGRHLLVKTILLYVYSTLPTDRVVVFRCVSV